MWDGVRTGIADGVQLAFAGEAGFLREVSVWGGNWGGEGLVRTLNSSSMLVMVGGDVVRGVWMGLVMVEGEVWSCLERLRSLASWSCRVGLSGWAGAARTHFSCPHPHTFQAEATNSCFPILQPTSYVTERTVLAAPALPRIAANHLAFDQPTGPRGAARETGEKLTVNSHGPHPLVNKLNKLGLNPT